MKPVKLVFSGLNSYRKEQSIDFNRLSEGGLFGIFGVTGAGKSTILDAMTLALFGDVNRAPNNTQGIINSASSKCFVSFTFDLSGHSYCAERVYKRKKGDNFAAQFDRGRLIVDDEQVLAEKSDEINRAVRSLLHMNCERFCQTVILPQGKFDRFIRMSPADRNKMFEELFDLERYGKRLSLQASQHLTLSEKQLEALDDKLSMLSDYSDDHISSLHKLIREGESEIKRMNELSVQQQKSLAQLEMKQKLAEELERQRNILEDLRPLQNAFEEKRLILINARAAEPLRNDLEAVKKEYAEVKKASLLNDQASLKLEKQRKELSAQTELLKQLEAEEQTMRNKEEHLQESLKRAIIYQQQAKELQGTIIGLQQEAQRSAWQSLLSQAEQKLLKLQEQLQSLDHQLLDMKKSEDSLFHQWEEALGRLNQLRKISSAAFLAADLTEGQVCPVCGSMHHPNLAHGADTVDLQAAEQQCNKIKIQLDEIKQQIRIIEDQHSSVQKEAGIWQEKTHQLKQVNTEHNSRLLELKRNLDNTLKRMQDESDCSDPQAEMAASKQRLEKFMGNLAQVRTSHEQISQLANEARVEQEKARNTLVLMDEQLAKFKDRLLQSVHKAGFPDINTALKALLTIEQRQQLTTEIDKYDQRRQQAERECCRLEAELSDGYSPALLEQARLAAAEISAELNRTQVELSRNKVGLETAERDKIRAQEIAEQRKEVSLSVDTWRRLCGLLKGNAFVRYLSRDSLRSIVYDASNVLLSLTAHRYQLELIEDQRGSDFIIIDNNNGGVRRLVSGLSGGETFIVSLALALALSRKIQMQSAPLGFFFLDEGFGALDDASLSSVMDVLERLPSAERCVGIITHVAAVRERVPRYLEIQSDPLTGSHAVLRSN